MRTLKLALLATVATAGLSSAAFAADLIIDEAPVLIDNTASFDWEGPYAGLFFSGQTTPAFGLGANLGINFLLDQSLLAGIEGEVSWLSDNSWQGQVDGRLGFIVDQAVIYGFAGYGFNSDTDGYVPVGAGVEFAVAEDLSVKAEYQYQWDLDNSADSAHVAKLGFNFHF